MGMHEFEDLVEETVRLLDSSDRADSLNLRSMFWQLYRFQACWDTGFTHFRVMDILLKRRFVYRFELNQHPDYERYRDYFDGLKEFTHLRLNPAQPWHERENPAIAYYKPPYLYCDAGSIFWQRMVEAGRLTGEDALAPDERIILIEVAKEAVLEAFRKEDFSFAGWWYSLLLVHLFSFMKDEELDGLKDVPAMRQIITLCYQANRRHNGQITDFNRDSLAWMWPFPKNMEVFPNLLRVLREENRADDRPETVAYFQAQRQKYTLAQGEEYPEVINL